MRRIEMLFPLTCILLIFFIGWSTQDDFPVLTGPYLGQKPPRMTPEVFAPELISTKEYIEFGCSFSPDGKEFYFSRTVDDSGRIYVMKLEENRWCGPFDTKISNAQYYSEPHVNHNGDKIFFTEFNPDEHSAQKFNITISVVEAVKETKNWSNPKQLWNGMYPTTTLNGDIYYTNTEKSCIVRRSYENNSYSEPERIFGAAINFPTSHPWIAPDESYIIFGGFNTQGQSKGEWADLYVSFRNKDGFFGKPINLGDTINNPYPNITPMITPDGRYLFYSNKGDIYWVSAKVIEELKPKKYK